MAMTLLGGIVRLAQALRLSVPLLYGALVITVFRPWYLTHTALADGIFFCTGGPRGTVPGGVPDPCGERNGSVTIRFGKIAKPYFLTTLLKSNNGFGEFTEPVVSYKPLFDKIVRSGIELGGRVDNIVNPSSLHAASIFMSFPFKAGFGNLAKPDFTYLHSGNSAESFRPQAAWGTGASPSKRVCHTNAMLASTPPQAALVSQRCR